MRRTVFIAGLQLLVVSFSARGEEAAVEEPRLWHTADDLPGNQVLAIAQAQDGYLWVGTSYALARFDGFRFSVFNRQELGVANLGYVVLVPGEGNTMWIGTARGEMLRWKDGRIVTCLTRGEENDAVWRIYPRGPDEAVAAKTGGIWTWSEKEGARRLPGPGQLEVLSGQLGLRTLRTAREEPDTLYYFSGGRCFRLSGDESRPVEPPAEGIRARRLWDVTDDADGRLWMVSDRELLWKDGAGGWHALPSLGEEGWAGHIMGNFPGGGIWIQINNRLRRATVDGWEVDAGPWPPAGVTSPAYADPCGRLWVAMGRNGMACILPDGTRRPFVASPRFGTRQIVRYFMDRQGNLWAGTADAVLVRWTPAQVQRIAGASGAGSGDWPVSPEPPPPVYVESCIVAGTEWLPPFPDQGIRAGASPGSIEFTYTGIYLSAPETLTFRYRLRGLDSDWREETGRRISYAGVPPGDFVFEVQAARLPGPWSRPASMKIAVEARMWDTAWFRVLVPLVVVAGAVFTGWLTSRRRAARRYALLALEKAREAERLRLARDLHDDLGARVTHLALVADLARRERGAGSAALESLHQGLQGMMGSLDEIVWAVDPRRDTLPDLAEYLTSTVSALFQSCGIACEVESTAPLPAVPVTSECRHHLLMAAREAAQNVIKHAGATRVVIGYEVEDAGFTFRISDNGRGFDPGAETPGDGRRNMNERMVCCGGMVTVHSSPGEGCRVVLELPLKKKA